MYVYIYIYIYIHIYETSSAAFSTISFLTAAVPFVR